MNFLFLKNKWQLNSDEYLISKNDLEIVQKNHQLEKGLKVKALIENFGISDVEVDFISDEKLLLTVKKRIEISRVNNVIIFVAISRPQTVKKVLEIAGTFGVAKVIFFKGDSTVKSYTTSKVFEKENVERHLIKGIEQSGNPFIPQIIKLKNTLSLLTEGVALIKDFNSYLKVLTSTRASEPIDNLNCIDFNKKIIVIGPESGLSEVEEKMFLEKGFISVSLGTYMLRVETALVYTLAKLKI